MLIPQNTSVGKKIIEVGQKHIGAAIRVVGVIVNDIAIERPLVASPDVDNDAHWTAQNMDGVAVVLNDTDPMWVITGTLGPIRVNKPAGDNVGIKISW